MVTAVPAHLQGFFELALVEMLLAPFALHENVFRFHDALFRRNSFNSLLFLVEPGHSVLFPEWRVLTLTQKGPVSEPPCVSGRALSRRLQLWMEGLRPAR